LEVPEGKGVSKAKAWIKTEIQRDEKFKQNENMIFW